MRLVLFGDGKWAADTLTRLLADGHDVLGVVLRSQPSDALLTERARQAGIECHTFTRINDTKAIDWIDSQRPDLNISVAYNQILRPAVMQSAPRGFINCHAGKLPYYRGCNIINWAIINGEEEIGVTVHYVDEGIDTGDIILQRLLPLGWHETYGDVLKRVQAVVPDIVAEAVQQMQAGTAERRPQRHLPGTYFGRRIPGDEWIDWRDTSRNIYNKIRAITSPAPGALTLLGDERMVLWRAQYDPEWPKYLGTPGEVIGIETGHGVRVKTGDSTIVITSVGVAGEMEPVVPKFRIGTRLKSPLNVNPQTDKLISHKRRLAS